ncbi:MAG: hypothetical protein ACREPM_07440, partial [Gemmatimonadaceae bacterium]
MATLAPLATESVYTPGPSPATAEPTTHWQPATRIAFRFCVIYFGLYVLTTQMLAGLLPIPGLGIPPLETLPPLRNLVLFVGTHVLGLDHAAISLRQTGSGDKLYN